MSTMQSMHVEYEKHLSWSTGVDGRHSVALADALCCTRNATPSNASAHTTPPREASVRRRRPHRSTRYSPTTVKAKLKNATSATSQMAVPELKPADRNMTPLLHKKVGQEGRESDLVTESSSLGMIAQACKSRSGARFRPPFVVR